MEKAARFRLYASRKTTWYKKITRTVDLITLFSKNFQ
jgi:hypothetical protein